MKDELDNKQIFCFFLQVHKIMDSNSIDVHRQSHKLIETTKTGDIIQPTVASITATKQSNDKEILSVQNTLPKVLYLKKLSHPTIQLKANSTMNSMKEPIPKLIVSTKSINLANKVITPDGVRYIAAARKSTTTETSDNSTMKQTEAIKSTKIIIKGITSQDKRLVVCESPTTTDPLGSPQLSPTLNSPPHIESNKNEPIVSEQRSMEIDERIKTPERAADALDEDNRPASTSSTPRANREMKQLQKTMKESKVLTDFVTLGDGTRRIKRKLNETEENEEESTEDTSQKIVARSRSLSVSKETNEVLISIRRNTRSLNAEFSAKQRKFLAGIQKHSRDSDDDHSDDDRGRGRRKANRKSGKAFVPLKVCPFFSFIFFSVCVSVWR